MKKQSLLRLATFALIALFVAVSLITSTGTASASAPSSAPAQSACTYTVRYGDTMFGIAARYRISIWELMRLNNLYYWGWIYAGQTLRVPCGSDGGGTNTGGCTYRATYVADVSIPDGTTLIAGSSFTKIWRVRNTGTCVWGNGYPMHTLTYVGGSLLGAPTSVEMNAIVHPGYEIDMVVPMVAPSVAGHYRSQWKFDVDGRALVGVGASNVPLYADINVGQPWPPAGIRVQFAPGTSSQILNGTSNAGETVRYVASARGGQVMTLNFMGVAPTPAVLAVSGANGELLLPSIYGKTSFTSTLPSTQDYFIDVTPNKGMLNFALQITIR